MITRGRKRTATDLLESDSNSHPICSHDDSTNRHTGRAGDKKFSESLPQPLDQKYFTDVDKVQLYASEYDTVTNLEAFGRSKRQIKQVIRFEPRHYSYQVERNRQLLSGHQGTGYNCPQCFAHLSYDEKNCYECKTQCKYSPGIGAVVCRDRRQILHPARFDENVILNKIELGCSEQNNSNPDVSTVESLVQPRTKKHEKQSTETNTKQPYDVGGCEACLKVFPLSYLNGHRLKVHALSSTEWACPHCPTKTFSSMDQRLEHILRKHPGQPYCVAEHVLQRTRCFRYTCSECTITLHYVDLKEHLQNEHGIDITECLDRIKTVCPFCDTRHFRSLDDLLSHVNSQHPNASMIGKKLPIGQRTIRSIPKKSETVDFEDTSSTTPKIFNLSLARVMGFIRLDLPFKRKHCNLVMAQSTVERMLDEVLKKVSTKIGKDGMTILIAGDEMEEEYISERRCFYKDVRDRTQKADRETLEKMKFKERWEQYHTYHSITPKKKNSFDIELNEFIHRPIKFGSKIWTSSEHKCDLCTNMAPNIDITGTTEDARTQFLSASFNDLVLSPSCSSRICDDRIDETESNCKSIHRNRRLALKMDLLQLMEAKNTLLFIENYNLGLIRGKLK